MKYNPHDYQIYAINFIKEHPIAAILLDMGMGKTSIVLAALNDLMFDSFEVTKVLIIAPLRVAKHTWSAEIQKWDQLRGLRYSIAVGTVAERMKALQADADIYIINRENVPWLIEKSGLPFDYDMVVIDELSSFKNWQAKRFKALMKVRPRVKRILMDVAALRSKVTFQKNETVTDKYGNHKNAWTDYYTCFATIGGEGLASSKEDEVAGTTVEDFSMTVSVRYCQKAAAIDSTHFRVMFMGEIYNIVNIDHMNFRKKSLKFTCRKERR